MYVCSEAEVRKHLFFFYPTNKFAYARQSSQTGRLLFFIHKICAENVDYLHKTGTIVFSRSVDVSVPA